jgi:four helix bundle protein
MKNTIQRSDRKEQFRNRLYGYILRLVRFLTMLPKNIVLNEIIRQLLKSGTSIGANFFEAQGSISKKDYQRFFSYSLKSSNESKFWLKLLIDSNLIPQKCILECDWLLKETTELSNIFAASILTMKKTQ